jgi:rod shape determining protein RodA
MLNDFDLSFVNYYLKKAGSFFLKFDFLQLIPLIILLSIGILFIYGTGQQIGIKRYEIAYLKQIQWIVLGSFIWLLFALTDYRKFVIFIIPLYLISLILLTLVLFHGKVIYGAQRWISIAGINFQPSELAKFTTLLADAWILSQRKFNINKFSSLALIAVVTGVPFILILIEPDLGSSLVLIAIVGFLLFSAKLNWRIIATPFVLFILYIAVTEVRWFFTDHPVVTNENRLEVNVKLYLPFLKEYQRERILVFLDPSRDMRNRGWNQYQAELAVGSGGLYGKGYMQGTQNTLGFLPQTVSNSDFIFPVIAEEWGFIGSTSLVILYIILVGSMIRTALLTKEPFGQYIAIGTSSIFFMHSVVNIGMSIRLMPVTGLPLPFLSYGGTFVVVSLSYMGLLQSIYIHRK